jgi:hypothetical protein
VVDFRVQGKVCNDAVSKMFAQSKQHHTTVFALISTTVAILLAVGEASGVTRRLVDKVARCFDAMVTRGAVSARTLRDAARETSLDGMELEMATIDNADTSQYVPPTQL